MTDTSSLADRYIAMWNETDPVRRRALIAALWTETARYVDPMMSGDGHGGIDAMVQAVQDRFPRHRFHRTTDVDGHNHSIRFGWALKADGAAPLAAGIDFGVIAGDGRLLSITGFLDQLPAAA